MPGLAQKGSYDIIQSLIHICQLSQQVLSVIHFARIEHQFRVTIVYKGKASPRAVLPYKVVLTCDSPLLHSLQDDSGLITHVDILFSISSAPKIKCPLSIVRSLAK